MKPQIANCIARFWSLRHSNWKEPVSSSHNELHSNMFDWPVGRSVARAPKLPRSSTLVRGSKSQCKIRHPHAASQCRPDTCYMLQNALRQKIANDRIPSFLRRSAVVIITSWCQRPDFNTTESSRMIGLVIVRGCKRRHVRPKEFFVMQPIFAYSDTS